MPAMPATAADTADIASGGRRALLHYLEMPWAMRHAGSRAPITPTYLTPPPQPPSPSVTEDEEEEEEEEEEDEERFCEGVKISAHRGASCAKVDGLGHFYVAILARAFLRFRFQ